MPAWYDIISIETEEPREWSSEEGGSFHAFRVTLRNSEGRELGNVEINKKPGNKPRLGSSNYGEIDTSGDYGPKFRYAKVPDGGPAVKGGQAPASSNGSGGGGDYYRPYAPEDLAAIRRQNALDFATRVLGPIGEGVTDDEYAKALGIWASHFESQVGAAAEAAEPEQAEEQPEAEAEEAPAAEADVPF